MDFTGLKPLAKIKYIGNSLAFGGIYTLIPAESTYYEASDCPEHERGKLMIVEFMNDDTPMFFLVEELDPNEWSLTASR